MVKSHLELIDHIASMNLGFIIQIEFFDHDIAYEITLSLFDHDKDIHIKKFYSDDAEFWGVRSCSVAKFSLEESFDRGYDLHITTIEELKAHLGVYLKQWTRDEKSNRQWDYFYKWHEARFSAANAERGNH